MSEIILYNTIEHKLMPFKSMEKDLVKMYCCGPTVYNYAHIGNLRTYIFEDFLRRVLRWNNYKVKHVMNITDVGHLISDADDGEDKMEKGAKRENKTVWEIAKFYEDAFLQDMKALNLLIPEIKPKATDHIQDMIDQIIKLEKNGYTYIGKNGNIYFDSEKFKYYGELAQLDRQNLQAGARIEVDKNKKNPHDFVLWFVDSKFANQDMQWESPWGRGYPGWHIECSAMSCKYLGEQFDIHCGGIDHIPVHHTNEIAQAEGANNKHRWVNYWLHGNFLVLKNKEKMSKSGNNFLRIQTLIEKGFSPLDYRYFCLQAHYRKELRFDWDGLSAAKTALKRLRDKVQKLEASCETCKNGDSEYILAFEKVINNDLNMPEALSLTWQLLDNKNINDYKKLTAIKKFDEVLGLNLLEKHSFEVPEHVLLLIEERKKARLNKNWQKSDELRALIEKEGFLIKDTKEGMTLE